MIIKSSGDMSLESLPPDGDDRWKSFLDDYNALKRDCVRVTRRLNLQDNTHNREKSVNLVHGVETEIAVPEDVEGRVKTVVALQVEGLTLDSTGKPNGSVYALGLSVPLAWRHSDDDGKVLVTAKYDTSPTSGVTARVNLLFVGE